MRCGVTEEARDDVATSGPCDNGSPTTEARAAKLRRFLQAYWLRPENALWMTLRSEALSKCGFESLEQNCVARASSPRFHRLEAGATLGWVRRSEGPSLDVACGDGVFLFLHGGGVFAPSFDVFQSVGALERVRDEHADMFDAATDEYAPPVIVSSGVRVNTGTDLKRSLLAKASRLGLYDELLWHDANDPLPVPSESFRTVYCNAAYWIENIEGFLREVGRVVQPGGAIILHVKLDTIRLCTLEPHRKHLGGRFLNIIGRGRLATWPSLASQTEWERRFAQCGLEIVSATPFVTRTHAHLWDVGLRPLAPMLVRMANGLSPETRADIKREWVDTVLELLTPFCEFELDLLPGAVEPVEMQYVLTVR